MTAPVLPLRVAVCGATGRMGRRLVRLVTEDPAWVLAGAIGSPAKGPGTLPGPHGVAGLAVHSDPREALAGADVLVDFSTPDGTARACAVAAERRIPAVIGTTGLDAEAAAAVRALSRVAPVVQAANTSAGVHVLLRLVREAVRLLGEGYDPEVLEIHHRGKVDAPSGTALALARAVADASPWGAGNTRTVAHREGRPGPRAAADVGVMALRGGDVVGEHTVLLLGDGERVELTHRCTDRDVFARGALRAARWVAAPGRVPGLYGMDEVLGGG